MVVVREEFANNALNNPIEIQRDSDESAADTALTVSTVSGRIRRLLFITVKYSASTSVDPTVTLNSGAGASWDTLLQTIAFTTATDGIFIPDEDIIIGDDEVIDVLAPAGGSAITAAVAIYTQAL